MEKLRINYPIIVEGKYDKIKILSVADACVIQTDGFGVFKNSERLALIRKLAEREIPFQPDESVYPLWQGSRVSAYRSPPAGKRI